MNILKQILGYLFWILISYLSAFGYLRIVLGTKPEPSKNIMQIIDWTYFYAFINLGAIIGSIIALLYMLLNLFYLKEKLKNNSKSTIFRFLIIILLTIIVGTTHYLFEKVIDII